MQMERGVKQKIQIALALAIAIAGIRTAYILYERHGSNAKDTPKEKEGGGATALNPDYYVTPKKLYPFDLKSARQLTKQPVWVKEGYRYPYYAYNPGTRRTDFEHEAGMLLPIQKLSIKDVVLDTAPNGGGQKQVMALFDEGGKDLLLPDRLSRKTPSTRFYSDAMLYIQDPRELYQHWPAEVWQSVEQHQVKQGMNELQADFAIGMGRPDRQENPSWKTVHYPERRQRHCHHLPRRQGGRNQVRKEFFVVR